LSLTSNALVSPGATDNISAVKTTAYSPNKTQFAKFTLTTVNTSGQLGPAVNLRNGSGRCNGFGLSWDQGSGELLIVRWTGNFEFYSVPYSVSTSISANDDISLECTDNHATSADTVKLRIYKNGVQIGTEQTSTYEDSFGAGQIGAWSSGTSNGVLDNFNGGDISASSPVLSSGTPADESTISSSANFGFNTDTSIGQGRIVMDTSANMSGVVVAQVLQGFKANSATAVFVSSLLNISATSATVAFTGINPGRWAVRAAQSATAGVSNLLAWEVNVPPTLSGATGTQTGAVSGQGQVTTNQSTGTGYAVVTTSATAPTKAQVKSGLNHLGAPAVWGSSQAISSTGTKTFNASGLTTGVAHYFHFMHEDADGIQSEIASSAAFTPVAGVAITSISSDNIVQFGETTVKVIGTSLGDTTGTLAITSNGVTQSQTPTSWTSTTATFDLNLGNLPYGTATFTLVTGA